MAPGRPRRCAACDALLPAAASRQRRYCSPACRSRAWRARRRRQQRYQLQVLIGRALVTQKHRDPVVRELGRRSLALQECLVCGQIIERGIRRRIDARYCGPACRTRAWRARRASRRGVTDTPAP